MFQVSNSFTTLGTCVNLLDNFIKLATLCVGSMRVHWLRLDVSLKSDLCSSVRPVMKHSSGTNRIGPVMPPLLSLSLGLDTSKGCLESVRGQLYFS